MEAVEMFFRCISRFCRLQCIFPMHSQALACSSFPMHAARIKIMEKADEITPAGKFCQSVQR